MPRAKKKKSSLQFRVFIVGELTISNLLDWFITLLLGGILCFNIVQLGGVRAEPQLMTAWMIGVLLVLHGLWFALSPPAEGYGIQKNGLLLVPFFAYAFLHWLVLSPVGWEARGDFIIFLEAFILFWIAVHNMRKRQHVWLLFAIVCFCATFTILPAFNQTMRQPEWGPPVLNPMDGARYTVGMNPVFYGRAAGTMGAPTAFAGLMLLILGPLLVGAFCRRLSPPVRVLCFFFSLMAMFAITLTQSLASMLAMTGCLLMAPFLLATRPKWKMYAFLGAILAPLAGFTYLYFSKPEFNAYLMGILQGDFFDARPALWGAALHNFLAHPIFGQGMSSFGWLFEAQRPEGYNLNPAYAHSAYLNFLADFGVIGALLLIPIVWMILQASRTLAAQPQYVLLEHPNKRRVVPNKRMFLTAVLMAFLPFAIQLFFEFNLRIPALLFIASVYLAIMVKCLPTYIYTLKANKLSGLVYISISIGLTVFLLGISSRYLLAQSYAFESERQLDLAAQALQERKGLDPIAMEDTLFFCREAAELEPNNPRILTNLARIINTQQFLYPSQHEALGEEATELAKQALEISPEYLQAWLALGTARWMAGDFIGAGEAYRQATVVAPNNPIAWYYLAAWLNLDNERRQEALQAVERSLELNPDNSAVQNLRLKILIP
ncbi:MAG: O-antigen ligase family protein [Puniceicoccales bacterium]